VQHRIASVDLVLDKLFGPKYTIVKRKLQVKRRSVTRFELHSVTVGRKKRDEELDEASNEESASH
jgi:hypothetical protein